MEICTNCESYAVDVVYLDERPMCYYHLPHCPYCGKKKTSYYYCEDAYCNNIRCKDCLKPNQKICEKHK